MTTGSARGCQGRGVAVRVHAPSALIRERLFDVCKRLLEVRERLFGALRFARAFKKSLLPIGISFFFPKIPPILKF